MKILPMTLLSLWLMSCTSKTNLTCITNDFTGNTRSDSAGITAQNFTFNPSSLFPKSAWTGEWIWLNESVYPEYQNTYTTWINNHESQKPYRALFRKDLILKKIPSSALLCITADVSFRVYINGNFVCQGPANIGSDYEDKTPPEHWFFTTHDVREYLQPGTNTLALEVYAFALSLSETTSGKGKLICDLHTGLEQTILSSDTTWKCKLGANS
ncbi:MAG: hypothetical protein JXQ65_03495 [Candidatus Marinimicrobia bacterium]|nr:hypothetical protein [Candidatus Neomarinimicrobiota bacterium]